MSFVVSVEASQETVTDVEPNRPEEVINGIYPLRRQLYGSDHSAVFLTECKAENAPSAALKMVPIERVTLAQLSYWRMVSGLSHPHLIRLFDAGLCQLGGRQFLFVVMEYAEQTLAQVLPQRALTPEEVRELLPPTLGALAFLHGKNLVHGQLKPTNLLVVNDQLKLASDTVCPAGEPMTGSAKSSVYDPPEAKAGRLSPASDIWSLGVTLVEALTQRLPTWPDEQSELPCLPTTLPADFLETVKRCLSRNPASRPTVTELEAQFKRVPQASTASDPEPVLREAAVQAAARQEPPRKRSLAPAIGLAIILSIAIWAGWRVFRNLPNSHPSVASALRPSQHSPGTAGTAAQNAQAPASAPPETSAPSADAKSVAIVPPPPPQPVSRPSDHSARATTDVSPSVVHEEIPHAPHSALNTIHGHVRVAVLVIVDPSGNVVEANLENPGPSWYFARMAREAAKKWKFAPAENQDARQWQLRFEFTRGGAAAHATPRS